MIYLLLLHCLKYVFLPLTTPEITLIKSWFMIFETKEDYSSVLNIDKNKIVSSTEVTLLVVKYDKQPKFESNIEELCIKAAYKLHAFGRIRGYLTVEKAKLLASAFINSQNTYAHLIWMFAGKSSIAKICKTNFVIHFEIHFKLFIIIMINHIMTY